MYMLTNEALEARGGMQRQGFPVLRKQNDLSRSFRENAVKIMTAKSAHKPVYSRPHNVQL